MLDYYKTEEIILKTIILKDLSTLKQEKGTALDAAFAVTEVLRTKLRVVDEDADAESTLSPAWVLCQDELNSFFEFERAGHTPSKDTNIA